MHLIQCFLNDSSRKEDVVVVVEVKEVEFGLSPLFMSNIGIFLTIILDVVGDTGMNGENHRLKH